MYLEALITPGDEAGYDPNNRRPSQFQLRRQSSAVSITSVVSSVSTFSTRSHRYETFDIQTVVTTQIISNHYKQNYVVCVRVNSMMVMV